MRTGAAYETEKRSEAALLARLTGLHIVPSFPGAANGSIFLPMNGDTTDGPVATNQDELGPILSVGLIIPSRG